MDLVEVSGAAHRRHPWEVARARFFKRVLADAGVLAGARRVLDVGAGDGFLAGGLLEAMPAGSQVVALDSNYTDDDLRRLTAAAPRGLSFAREAPPERFDVILMLDVIEHVPDDRAFLGEILAASLAPGGVVLVSVPAWQGLFSTHDTALKHYRRYSPRACAALLADEGLVPIREGGLFHSLLLPRALTVAREGLLRLIGKEPTAPDNLGAWRGGALLSSALERALAVDNALTHALARRGRKLPGLSVWALCQVRAEAAA
jgi:SAM-dependent methyltransferase